MQAQEEDRRAQGHARRLGGQACQQGDGLEHLLRGAHGIVLGGEDPIEPALPGSADLLQGVVQGLGAAELLGEGGIQVDAELQESALGKL